MTIGDIIIFHELSQFMHMCGLTIDSDELRAHEFLSKWYTQRMIVDQTIAKYDKEMKAAAKESEEKLDAFNRKIYSNKMLYDVLVSFKEQAKESGEWNRLTHEDRVFVNKVLIQFMRAGIYLSEETLQKLEVLA